MTVRSKVGHFVRAARRNKASSRMDATMADNRAE